MLRALSSSILRPYTTFHSGAPAAAILPVSQRLFSFCQPQRPSTALHAQPQRMSPLSTSAAAVAEVAQVQQQLDSSINGKASSTTAPSFQEAIKRLQEYWASVGCIVWLPHNTEVGAGTMNPATFLRYEAQVLALGYLPRGPDASRGLVRRQRAYKKIRGTPQQQIVASAISASCRHHQTKQQRQGKAPAGDTCVIFGSSDKARPKWKNAKVVSGQCVHGRSRSSYVMMVSFCKCIMQWFSHAIT